MKNYYIDLHVHTNYSREDIANLSVKDTLEYYQEIGARHGERIIIRINDHNTIFGGVAAVEEYINNKDKYPNIFVIPGMECNVSLNQVLKIKNPKSKIDPNFPNDDSKYLFAFKKAHIGVAPILKDKESFKKWKNHVGLQVYSRLAKMTVDLRDGKGIYHIAEQTKAIGYPHNIAEKVMNFTNLGEKIISCKNLIRKKLGVIIPFEALQPCVEDGLTHDEIVKRFKECCVNFLEKLPEYSNYQKEEINNLINSFASKIFIIETIESKLSNAIKYCNDAFKTNISISSFSDLLNKNLHFCELKQEVYNKLNSLLKQDEKAKNINDFEINSQVKFAIKEYFNWKNYFNNEGGNKRINIDELSKMVYEAGGIMDFEHPNNNFRIHKNAVVPCGLLKQLDYSMLKYETSKRVRDILSNKRPKDLIKLESLFGHNLSEDYSGLIRAQIVVNAMRESPNFKFNNNYIGVEIAKKLLSKSKELEKIISTAEHGKLLVSVGFDKHMNIIDKYKQYLRNGESFVDENGKTIAPTEKLTRDLYDSLLNDMSLNEYGYYDIDDDKSFAKSIILCNKNGEESKEEFKARMERVVQTAYCDVILGKDVDFKNSSMFSIKRGSIIPEELKKLDLKTKMLANSMANVFIDTFNYSKEKQVAEKFGFKEYMNNLQKDIKNKTIRYGKAFRTTNVENLNAFEEELTEYSHEQIDCFAKQVEENEVFK